MLISNCLSLDQLLFREGVDKSDVFGANCTPGHALVQDLGNSIIHTTHSPHSGLSGLLVLGEPVINVVDVEGTGSPAQTLDEGRNVEVLEAGSGTGKFLTGTTVTG